MEYFIQLLSWSLFVAFIIIQGVLLLCKKRQAALYNSSIMIACGAIAMILGLIYFLYLGVYGVLVQLVGLVFHLSTKDQMEKG